MVSVWKTGCDTSACVKVNDDLDSPFVYIGATWHDDFIPVERAEWAAFKQAVKDGKFD